nr:peptidyl-prolyl cis-trans isomerase 1 [Quercus suber]
MIQGGDIQKQDGSGTTSIYDGAEFEDEHLDWREMDAAGLVCSANRGKDTNGSQFFITLVPCEHLNQKHTIFGRLVSGQDVLAKIATVAVDNGDRPLEPVLVAHCGELERRKKQKMKERSPQPSPALPDGRGRRRKSDDSDQEMHDSPEPLQERRGRRQSDNIIDEGLRGRPRNRSDSRSDPRPSSTPEERDRATDNSPAELHKRKRSPSPSRHHRNTGEQADEDEDEPRRRRSLPNQYADGRRHREVRGEEARYRPSPRREDPRAARGKYRADQERYERNARQSERGGGGDSWRPSHRSARRGDEGRLDGEHASGSLGGKGGYDEHDPPVKFKGRGIMKYREPGRL